MNPRGCSWLVAGVALCLLVSCERAATITSGEGRIQVPGGEVYYAPPTSPIVDQPETYAQVIRTFLAEVENR